MFNKTSETSVGLQISEFLGTKNNHFIQTVANLANRGSEDDENGSTRQEKLLEPQHLS